jgi:hypothetical protein
MFGFNLLTPQQPELYKFILAFRNLFYLSTLSELFTEKPLVLTDLDESELRMRRQEAT